MTRLLAWLRGQVGEYRQSVGLLLIAAGMVGFVAYWGGVLQLPNPDTVSPDPAPSASSAPSFPGWAKQARARSLTMTVRLTGDEHEFHVDIDYVLKLAGTDPLVEAVREGDARSTDLADYLAGGPANSPVTLEYSSGADTAIAHFTYSGSDFDFIDLGSEAALTAPAATAVQRDLTVIVTPGVISGLDATPDQQDAHHAHFTDHPRTIQVTVGTESAGSDADDTAVSSGSGDGGGWPYLSVLTNPWVPWGVVILLPFLVVALTASRSGIGSPVLREVAQRTAWVTIAIGVVATYTIDHDAEPWPVLIGLVTAAPLLFGAELVRAIGQEPWRKGWLLGCLSTGLGFLGVALAETLAIGSVNGRALTLFLGWTVGGAALGAAALHGRWRSIAVASVVAIFTAGFAQLLIVAAAQPNWYPWVDAAMVGTVPVVLLVVRVTTAASTASPTRISAMLGYLAAAVLGAVLLIPIVGVFAGSDPASVHFDRDTAVVDTLKLVDLMLGAAALALLWWLGRTGAVLRIPVVTVAALVLALCVVADPDPSSWYAAIALASLWVTWPWLLPRRRRSLAARLGRASATAHHELLQAESRRRLLWASSRDYYRQARGQLVSGDRTVADYDVAQDALDQHAAQHGVRVERLPIREALSTGAGRSPRANGLRAIGFSAAVSAALIGYEIYALKSTQHAGAFSDMTTAQLLNVGRHLARWPIYALLYGYLFPLLRGHTPVAKALAFALAVLPAELVSLCASPGPDLYRSYGVPSTGFHPRDLLIAMLIRVGQVSVFFISLGLIWERAMAMTAGFGWDRIRNLRSLRSVGAPLSTVAVAVATAVGTALAGAAVAAMFATGTGVPIPEPSSPPPSSTSQPKPAPAAPASPSTCTDRTGPEPCVQPSPSPSG